MRERFFTVCRCDEAHCDWCPPHEFVHLFFGLEVVETAAVLRCELADSRHERLVAAVAVHEGHGAVAAQMQRRLRRVPDAKACRKHLRRRKLPRRQRSHVSLWRRQERVQLLLPRHLVVETCERNGHAGCSVPDFFHPYFPTAHAFFDKLFWSMAKW